MTAPRIVPREQHVISRRNIDPDALKVLYRLRQGEHVAYLVGGSVRDLLLGRRPKDFDIGTSAHPYEVKKLFRNCWIIGRRFRLAHVKFGPKVIEVATFRRQVAPGEEVVQDGVPAPDPSTTAGQLLVHHDNTFGTPEEDAFRRDFTINALFYDIATFSVIDYVNGLDDLGAGIVRSIGDPDVRLKEDPVRMIRAIALAARLDFTIEPALLASIRTHRREISKSSAPRMLEEYYKILRAGAAEQAFRSLAAVGLLEPTSPELHAGAGEPLWKSLAALDAYRRRFESTPETLTNAILLGTLLVPLGAGALQALWNAGHRPRPRAESSAHQPPQGPRLGTLPLAKRDVERLRQILSLQRRLQDLSANPRVQRGIAHRPVFADAVTWLEIHGHAPELVEHWKALTPTPGSAMPTDETGASGDATPPRRRRRRRRRRFTSTQ
jgi:poly(A) polymerase